jgi:hypothetical protein
MACVANATPQPLSPQETDLLPVIHMDMRAPEPVGTSAENLTLTGIRSRNSEPIATRYTDYSIPTHLPTRRLVVLLNALLRHHTLVPLRLLGFTESQAQILEILPHYSKH